jgi:hypothetical protein
MIDSPIQLLLVLDQDHETAIERNRDTVVAKVADADAVAHVQAHRGYVDCMDLAV